VRFETQAKEMMLAGQYQTLVEYEKLGQEAMLSIPTPNHYLVWSKYSNAAFCKAFRPVLTLSHIFIGAGRVLPLEMLGWRGRLQGLRRRDEQKTFTLGSRS
jgi:hypothetical protein